MIGRTGGRRACDYRLYQRALRITGGENRGRKMQVRISVGGSINPLADAFVGSSPTSPAKSPNSRPFSGPFSCRICCMIFSSNFNGPQPLPKTPCNMNATWNAHRLLTLNLGPWVPRSDKYHKPKTHRSPLRHHWYLVLVLLVTVVQKNSD